MASKKLKIEFTTYIDVLQHLVGMHYLFIPEKIVKKAGGIGTRLLCTVNSEKPYQCGMVSLGNGTAYISINKKRLKDAGLTKGDEVQVSLEPDTSEYGMEVPDELQELFKQDSVGFKRFEGLTPGKQRYIINYVATVKSPQLRVDRAILLIENLKKLPLGKESFRAMLGLE